MPPAALSRRSAKPKVRTPFNARAAKQLEAIHTQRGRFELGPIDQPGASMENEALHAHKKTQGKRIRVRKEKTNGEITRVTFTNQGKFDQLFRVPYSQTWEQLPPEKQERFLEHYVRITTQFLTGTARKTEKGTRRLSLAETRDLRIPLLVEELSNLRTHIQKQNEMLRNAQASLHNPNMERQYTRNQVDAIREHVEGLEKRASIAAGVVEKLRTEDQHGELLERAELGRKRFEALRRRQPEFSTNAARRLLALHTRLTGMENGAAFASENARERIAQINAEHLKGMKLGDRVHLQTERIRARGGKPTQEIIPRFRGKYRRALHQIKDEWKGLIRVKRNPAKKNAKEGERNARIQSVHLTTLGKFRQLFLNPATRKWDEYKREHQDRLLAHYVHIATKFLTSRNQLVDGKRRRMKVDEAREEQVPLLKNALVELRGKIGEMNEQIRFAIQNQQGESQFRVYDEEAIRELRHQREGLLNRASILEGVVARLGSGDYAPELVLDAENKGKKGRGAPPVARKKPVTPRKTKRVSKPAPTRETITPSASKPEPEIGNERALHEEQPESVRRARTENESRLAGIEQKRAREKRLARLGVSGRLKRRVRVHWKILRGKTRYARDLRRKGFSRFNPFRKKKDDKK